MNRAKRGYALALQACTDTLAQLISNLSRHVLGDQVVSELGDHRLEIRLREIFAGQVEARKERTRP